jgi:tetratricopeptide (TPR) repeat protein
MTRGPLRAAVAFLGARLALRDSAPQKTGINSAQKNQALELSCRLLRECLEDQPDHVEALWCLAAVRSVLGDGEGLAAQAPAMDRPGVSDPRFHFLGAVCALAARNYPQAITLGQRVLPDEKPGSLLEVESRFVMAWAHLHLGQVSAAEESLRRVAASDNSPSAVYARALLGRLSFQRGGHDEAISWWSGVESAARARWNLDEPLRQTVLFSGLTALEEQRFEEAAERFREAGRFGLRDRRLGGLITLALVRAGQCLLYDSPRE